jgi:hypothetical protein
MRTAIASRLGPWLLGVAGAASLLACALSPAGALAAGCPNEAIRETEHVTALLPDCRAYEMITPVNKNDQEVTVPFYTTADEVPFQASVRGPGSTFTMTGGFPGSESTAQFAVGIGTGGAIGSPWSDLALSPETRFGRLGTEGTRHSGDFLHYSPTLSCGVETTALPQAKNHGEAAPEVAPGELASDEVQRLYMWSAPAGAPPSDTARGTYTLVTSVRPREPGGPYSGGGWQVDGASEDCTHVAFETGEAGYELPLTPSSKEYAPPGSLYEWSPASGPRVASLLPDGIPATSVLPLESGLKGSDVNLMSADGSRLLFTATSDESAAPEERGDRQVFTRVKGAQTIQISASDTGTPDRGSKFQAASRDGSKVFFTANYGLTEQSSSGPAAPTSCSQSVAPGQGCDLYEYDAASGKLTDLSVDTGLTGDTSGADVRGVVGISRDGSYVYFSTGGQLIAGEGNSGAVNEAQHDANVYAYHAGRLSYVATITEAEAGGQSNLPEKSMDALSPAIGSGLSNLVARVSPNGRYLLLGSKNQLTSYNNLDANAGEPDPEIYEYSYTEGPPSLSCPSCDPSGKRPVRYAAQAFSPLGPFEPVRDGSIPENLLSDGRVFFDSYTPLVSQEPATTATVHVYEWRPNAVAGCAASIGCVSLLDPGTSPFASYFEGASEDGENVYMATSDSLAPQDVDHGLRDLYDVRTGGGIPQAAPAPRCSLVKDTCQGEGEQFARYPIAQSSTSSNEPPLTLLTPRPSVAGPVRITGHSFRGGVLTLLVSLPSPGTLAVSGTGVLASHRSEARAGAYRLNVALNARTRAALRRHSRVRVSVRVRFTPASGPGSSAALTANFR